MSNQGTTISVVRVREIASAVTAEARQREGRGIEGPEWGVTALLDAIEHELAATNAIEPQAPHSAEAGRGEADAPRSFAVTVEDSMYATTVVVASGADDREARRSAERHVASHPDAFEWAHASEGGIEAVDAVEIERCTSCDRWRCPEDIATIERCGC